MAELLKAFDEVRGKHEKMDSKEFNEDGTYKAGINLVGAVRVSAEGEHGVARWVRTSRGCSGCGRTMNRMHKRRSMFLAVPGVGR